MRPRPANMWAAAAAGCACTGAAMGQFLLYDNGPLATSPTGACIPAGNQASEVQAGNVNAGYNASAASGYRVADDFTIFDPQGWPVTGVRFFAYQTGAPAGVNTYTKVTLRIWNGPPASGAAVILGDTTTNMLSAASVAHVYRYFNAACGTDRALWNLDCSLSTWLYTGTYWLDWDVTGSAAFDGPWAPPTTFTGSPGPLPPHTPGNALQLVDGVWIPVRDSVPQDFAFQVFGLISPQFGACCLPAGSCLMTTPAGCAARAGVYRGNGTVCTTVQCVPSEYNEHGDAGDTLANAQAVRGPAGAHLMWINGSISASGDADLYEISICDPATFRATTAGGTQITRNSSSSTRSAAACHSTMMNQGARVCNPHSPTAS